MNVRISLAVALVAAALTAGCVTPTPAELQTAEEARTQVQPILETFALALREQDPALMKPILSPYLRPTEVGILEKAIQNTTWLALYEEYSPDFASALAGVDWREWQKDLVVVGVPYADAFGAQTVDRFSLHHRDGHWSLVSFALKPVAPGDRLTPPYEVRNLLQERAGQLLAKLRAGHIMEVYYALPNDALYRYVERTWWEKATQDKPDHVSILNDLEQLQRFTVMDWPKPQESTFIFAENGGVNVHYDIPYVWPAAGIVQPDVLRMDFNFLPVDDGWLFHQLRLAAIGIPYTD